MGMGPLRLIADTDEEPRELLRPFLKDWGENAQPEDFYVEHLDESDFWEVIQGKYGYILEMDCSITLFCSYCGIAMCPGCGSAPDVISVGDYKAGSCPRHECQRKYAALLRASGFLPRGKKLRALVSCV